MTILRLSTPIDNDGYIQFPKWRMIWYVDDHSTWLAVPLALIYSLDGYGVYHLPSSESRVDRITGTVYLSTAETGAPRSDAGELLRCLGCDEEPILPVERLEGRCFISTHVPRWGIDDVPQRVHRNVLTSRPFKKMQVPKGYHLVTECQGHPAGPDDPMGQTVYCDGSCNTVNRVVDDVVDQRPNR